MRDPERGLGVEHEARCDDRVQGVERGLGELGRGARPKVIENIVPILNLITVEEISYTKTLVMNT